MAFVPNAAFEVNEPNVICETIDDETVIINLSSGSYYSLKQSGSAIWYGIQRLWCMADIAAVVRATLDVGSANIEAEIGALIDRLLEEDLIRTSSTGAVPVSVGRDLGGFASKTFSPPTLDKFTDMEGMLLIDPVHDVDDEGWPQAEARQHA